ncbi:uncharacterized protein CDAR_387981 [Caerostris darwini]|uniref:Uncharacterized protein n=1 Tax=Caerostris darwini TaxID=1538125 RepID=A0AAV4SSM8_9ARAC|nr:uncharacterized protein CDAR_387981 [Caerostris darwini]
MGLDEAYVVPEMIFYETCSVGPTSVDGDNKESSGKMVLVLLLFVVCNAYDISSEESGELEEVKRPNLGGNLFLKRYGLDEDMAKRALSLLARWRPQLVGLPRVNTRSDIVTRGGGHSRPLGQPLRWG